MDARLMPLATFRCLSCGEQESVTLTRHTRRADKPDILKPHPSHHRERMLLVQVDYQGRA